MKASDLLVVCFPDINMKDNLCLAGLQKQLSSVLAYTTIERQRKTPAQLGQLVLAMQRLRRPALLLLDNLETSTQRLRGLSFKDRLCKIIQNSFI